MRREIAMQLLDIAYGRSMRGALSMRDVEAALRVVITDPLEAERKVGMFYGLAFKRLEAQYDASGGAR